MTLREEADWEDVERLIVVTDEQSHDGILPAWTRKAYVINVAHTRAASAMEMAGCTLTAGASECSTIAAIEGENAG
jgi:hypothetical protein